MYIRSRVTQDRRFLARIPALLECAFTFQGEAHQAVILDLSLNSALLSSQFLPPNGAPVTVSLASQCLKMPLKLEGKVVRGGKGISDHGELSRFGVRFEGRALELMSLVSALHSQGSSHTPPAASK